MRPTYLLSLVVGLGLAACTSEPTESAPDAAPVYRATWYQDVAPMLANRCMTCHQPGGIAPFSMTEYEGARENSLRMLAEISRGAMPPFDAREEADCTPRFGWIDDPRLTIAEKATLQAWVDDGHPLGTVAPIPAPPGHDLTGVTATLTPSTPFTASGLGDQFICFVLDPNVTAQVAWLTGLQVLPDNELVVHHAVVTEVFPGAAHDALVAQRGIGQPWDCSAENVVANFPVSIWTPGNQPLQTSTDIAVPILGGSKLVMQIHYHPAGTVAAPDATAIQLRMSTVWPKRMYFVAAFGNEFQAPDLLPGPNDGGAPRFFIPKNVGDHTEHMRVTVPDLSALGGDARLFSANPHMHLIGTHISGTIERPAARGGDPQIECVANGAWNFDWQRTYQYNAPLDKLPSIQGGDIIDIKCMWDNRITNPFVQRMLADSGLGATPIDVRLGEQTTNEMCLEIFGMSLPAPPQQTLLTSPTAFADLMAEMSRALPR